MAVKRRTVTKLHVFDHALALTTTPGANGWTIAKTGSGTPTYLVVTADGMKLTLDNTSEAQVASMYMNDVLGIPLAKLDWIEFIIKVAGIDSVTTLTMGVGSARNDTADSVSTNAWFRMEGSVSTSALVAETDDGTTDTDDKSTGTTLAAVSKALRIDFTAGLSNIRFFVDGDPVATGSTFTLAAATSTQHVQPIVQIQKASGTGVPSVSIRSIEYQYREALGA